MVVLIRRFATPLGKADQGDRWSWQTLRQSNRSVGLPRPSIIEQIAHGHQPPELTAQALSTRRGDLPLSWQTQREILGFEARA